MDYHHIDIALSAIAFIVGFIAIVKCPSCGMALLFSAGTGLLFSLGDNPQHYLHYNMMIFSAFLCIFHIEDGEIVRLNMVESEVPYAIGYLFLIRMIVGLFGCESVGILDVNTALMISMAILALQDVLVLLGVSNGSSRTVNNLITNYRNRGWSLVLSSIRVQPNEAN
tara:strand:- start:270 stop:773 length:504 start_codon:yes stop_codon:yes gene_type:complete